MSNLDSLSVEVILAQPPPPEMIVITLSREDGERVGLALLGAFIWKDTLVGEEFWQKIHAAFMGREE